MAKRRFLLIPLLIAGCGVTDTIQSEKDFQMEQSLSIKLDLVEGDAQSASVGKEMGKPLTVKATNLKDGTPAINQMILFQVVSGSAQIVGTDQVSTDTHGVALARVVSGEVPGDIQVEAKAITPQFVVDRHVVQFILKVVPAKEPQLVLANPLSNGQHGIAGKDLPVPLSIEAIDVEGNPSPGETVEFQITKGSPTSSIVPAVVTNSDGVATAVLSPGTSAGDIEVKAVWKLNGAESPNRTVTFTATVSAGPPSVLSFVRGAMTGLKRACAGENKTFSEPITVRLTDPYGNRLSNLPVSILTDATLSVDQHSFGSTVQYQTDDQGELQFQLSSGSFGGNAYSLPSSVRAFYSGDGISLLASTTFDITRNNYLSLESDSSVENYGSTGFSVNPPNFYFQFPIHVSVKGKCWAPTVNVPVTVTYSQVTNNVCPSAVLTWPSDDPFGQMTTNSKGEAASTATVYVQTITGTRIANRLTVSAPNTNTLTLYAGPGGCF